MLVQEGASSSSLMCSFVKTSDPSMVQLAEIMEQAAVQLRKEVPQELVVTTFQKLVRPDFHFVHHNCNITSAEFAVHCLYSHRQADRSGHKIRRSQAVDRSRSVCRLRRTYRHILTSSSCLGRWRITSLPYCSLL